MRIPDLTDLERNLRETLVVRAEVLMLGMGGELGAQLASLVTGGLVDEHTIPTDTFDGTNLDDIPVAHLAIHHCLIGLRALLEAKSLGRDPTSTTLDSDYIRQEYLDLLELYLSSLPDMTFGGFDWGGCRNGAMRALLLAGQAWHRLLCMIDEGTYGDFDLELITATDLAMLADLEVRSVRNLVGPQKRLRSKEHHVERKTQVSERGFATINRFDALDWLVSRKDFKFSDLKPSLLAARLDGVANPVARGRAAILCALVRGLPFSTLAARLNLEEKTLRDLADGIGQPQLAERITQHVLQSEQAFCTAPA